MRLVVLCPHFAPDVAPTGEVITRIVERARGPRPLDSTSSPRCRGTSTTRSSPSSEGRRSATRRRRGARSRASTRSPPTSATSRARALAFGGFTALAGAVGVTGGPSRRRAGHVAAAHAGAHGLGSSRSPAAPRSCSTSRTCSPTWRSSSACSRGERVIAAARWLERASYAASRRRDRALRRPPGQRRREDRCGRRRPRST